MQYTCLAYSLLFVIDLKILYVIFYILNQENIISTTIDYK